MGHINYFINKYGECSPECDKKILPLGITIKDVYCDYKCSVKPHELLSKSRFYAIWKTIKHDVILQRQVCAWLQSTCYYQYLPYLMYLIHKITQKSNYKDGC